MAVGHHLAPRWTCRIPGEPTRRRAPGGTRASTRLVSGQLADANPTTGLLSTLLPSDPEKLASP